MDTNIFLLVFFFVHSIGWECVQSSSFIGDDEKIVLRRSLDEVTQGEVVGIPDNQFYHSYTLRSGVGNREELHVDSIEKDVEFPAGTGVRSWQSVQCEGKVHLVGCTHNSVTLIVTSSQLSPNRSAHFSEHTLDMGSPVVSTTSWSRWNITLTQEEVIVAVALDNSAADILWYRVVENKLVNITRWSHYKRISCLAATKGGRENQIVVISASSPAVVNVFNIILSLDGSHLDLRLMQSFPLESECSSVTVCQVASQTYLIFVQPSNQSVAVYRRLTSSNTSYFDEYTTLTFPHVSQVVSFTLASQVYLAVNGDNGQVFRLADDGHFVEQLTLGSVEMWLAVPVSSYRSDVILFSKHSNNTKAYIWGGTDKGFVLSTMPDCNSCLEGDWTGSVSIQFRHRNCLLLPEAGGDSFLISISTSLHNKKNPIKEEIDSMIKSMKHYEERLKEIHEELVKAEESLKHVVKVDGENVITGKWKMVNVSTQHLTLSSVVNDRSASRNSSEQRDSENIDIPFLNGLVEDITRSTSLLQNDVLLKEKEVWGLENFSGKVSFEGRLTVDNLTIERLNGEHMNDVLLNTYRKDKPQKITGSTVIKSLQVEHLHFGKVKSNWTGDNIKFSDGPVVIKGNLTLLHSLTVNGKFALEAGGRVNRLNLSEQLCQGEKYCTVFPSFGIDLRGKDITESPTHLGFSDIRQLTWKKLISGMNITVMKINDIDWKTLVQNVVFTDQYQQIPETTIVDGTISSDAQVWMGNVKGDYNPQLKDADKLLQMSADPPNISAGTASRKIEKYKPPIDPYSDIIFTELEVIGDVICEDSEWGGLASDVILSDANMIHVFGDKTFKSDVNIENNLEVKGLVGGVNVSNLLTTDSAQVFSDPTTLHGNVTLSDVTLSGSWNRVNIVKDTSGGGRGFSVGADYMRQVSANHVVVTESLNGVPVSDLVFTDRVTSVDELAAGNLSVKGYTEVSGKVCNQYLNKFVERRLSIKDEQNISGNLVIKNAIVSKTLQVANMNGENISSALYNLGSPAEINEIHLSVLHVDGNISTDFGLNGYNLSHVAENAVMLLSNNIVTGHLHFKENVTIERLDCQGFFNQQNCQESFDVSDVVMKTSGTKIFSGNKKFLKPLNILEDVYLEQLNGHKFDSILTTTTDQIIEGNITVHGNLSIEEEFKLEGFLNHQNITEISSRCLLSEDTITCTGDVKFEETVNIDHLNCKESINGINFDHFTKSLVDVKNPQPIKGLKKFTGKVTVTNIDVHKINNVSWDDFLVNTITQDANEAVEREVIFTEKVNAFNISVDFNINAESINGVDLNEWRNNAIYLNKSFNLNRTLHLNSASSAGNLTVVTYGDVNMGIDVIKLHYNSILDHLQFDTVTVLNSTNIGFSVNRRHLETEEQTTLKKFGDQVVDSDVVVAGDVSVTGNITISGLVNYYNLSEVVTLDTPQILHGNYKFECVQVVANVTSTGLMSAINMSEWVELGLKDKGEQVMTGSLTVLGDVELRGPVQGRGRLGGVQLAELNANITRDVLDVHAELKNNLTSVCERTNDQIKQARNQTSEFQYLDVTQEISSADGVSLVTHFTTYDGDFLTINDNKNVITVYMWNKSNSSYTRVFSQVLGYKVGQLVALRHNHLTYLVSASPGSSDKHVWLFTGNSFQHVSLVDLGSTNAIQEYNNRLYSMNDTGFFKWTMNVISEGVRFKLDKIWRENTDGKRFIPEDLASLEPDFLLDARTLNNCSGEIVGVSVSVMHGLIAATTTEKTQVPKFSDHVKIYHLNGSMFDKIPAQQASHLHWFPVPGQTWLIFIDGHAFISLHRLYDVYEGFHQMFSAKMEGIISLSTLTLPVESKVNRQPYVVVQTSSTVKVLKTFLEGDPYLKPDISCSYDDDLHTINVL